MGEIAKCLRNLKNSKTGGSDGIVGESLKYGGSGMVDLLEQLFSVIWQEEFVPRQIPSLHSYIFTFARNLHLLQ